MKFECGDLDRALQIPELMQEARQHLKECPVCRRELRLWNDISDAAKQLHQEWDSPQLWSKIHAQLAAEPRRKPSRWADWKLLSLAASVIVGAVLLVWFNWSRPVASQSADSRTFLTDQALHDVERNEAAYRDSIERLYQVAAPKLKNAESPLVVSYRERLVLLDSAIGDVRANLRQNRFNTSLQAQLASLYREKRQTLEDLVKNDQKN
jgi:4-amino-4-deoxy-L-arabinose transferase-like glycosyltransferase